MSHYRVIPRDFFNEAKLLKCLGQLQLAIQENRVNGLPLCVDFDGKPFKIAQLESGGSLCCLNYKVYLSNGERLVLFTPYNSKEAYPLIAEYRGEEYYVFDEKGSFMPNFGFPKSGAQ